MLSEKKLAKLEKELGREMLDELNAMGIPYLYDQIVKAEQNIKTAVDELEANPQFQALKDSIKDLSEGLRDVKKRQNALIQYSLHLLEEKGKA